MRFAVEGCTHGELEKTYETIKQLEQQAGGSKVDLLICCGDFQSTRNLSDLACMACPDKYKDMCSFYKYYSGEAIAPILTIFIGGNHEATNYLQELAYGGWVAPNIYYLGYAGVISVNGIRIGGLSGIFKGFDYLNGHHEKPPYDGKTQRSAYHVRNVEVFRLKQLADQPPTIMMSHDWPQSVYKHGNTQKLLKVKKHFRDDVEQDRLGSGPTKEVLDTLQPQYWFSAHLHVKFPAVVPHLDSGRVTKFLALDKCLPRRQFLQILEVGPPVTDDEVVLRYDPSWLAILRSTNHLLSVENKPRYTPGPGSTERFNFRPTDEEIKEVEQMFGGDLEIPYNFEQTALAYKPSPGGKKPNLHGVPMPQATTNKQTTLFCSKLKIYDPMALLLGTTTGGKGVKKAEIPNYHNNKEELSKAWDSVAEKSQVWDSFEFDDSRTNVYDDSDCVGDKVIDVSEKISEVKEPVVSKLKPMSIPSPKEDCISVDFLSVLDSISSSKESSCSVADQTKTKDDFLKIDTVGEPAEEVDSNSSEASEVPVKKFKRRNAAIYNDGND